MKKRQNKKNKKNIKIYTLKDIYLKDVNEFIMNDFYQLLKKTFNLESLDENNLNLIENTFGWHDCFKIICNKYKLNDLKNHLDLLNWNNYDIFCKEFDDLFFKFHILKK